MRNTRGPTGGAERLPDEARLPMVPSSSWLWVRRLVMATALAFALGYLPYRFYLRLGLSQYLELQAELTQLHDSNRKLWAENRQLRIELDMMQGDDHAIERVARDELGLIRPKEIIFKVDSAQPAGPLEPRMSGAQGRAPFVDSAQRGTAASVEATP